ncbi:MAG: hypothetical protein A2W93_12100 [Bacteroidetes bacterium GWF2_43_63]|nr:MAG: hypothetical protein A2W94_11540 [Bacteroidetes bacterium GWE2_42_42]OFY56365.1 MAG: hypothetical protein A2W93_12100 [Bacteroidetes bacterium GWF2_43_63]HBG69671.1 hypothetical protein [Bacteroidales bacterium]HCB61938.1 hypothetical protein [Bacteroidales bacterium]HCY42283.1 hypothetical protein [Prolixibacteraceae bacterium]
MAKIHSLKIHNYRGIEKFEHTFGSTNFVCLIGRGDSGKTTILNAISAVLSPNWNYTFFDTDFYNGDISNNIVIEANIIEVPSELLTESKFGLYKRLLNSSNEIIDDITLETDDCADILSIKLVVKNDLEPKWYIFNGRIQQEDIEISSYDRAKLNVFLVSDYLDKHFSWSKGTPLFSLRKQSDLKSETNKLLLDANRKAKEVFLKTKPLDSLDSVVSLIKDSAATIGLSLDDLSALIDNKDSMLNEGNISLHVDSIPCRLKGKGSKRLLSIAIQLELAKKGGIVLIDEVEQGLEPDRVKFLVNRLFNNKQGQVFITTHSNNVLVEIDAKGIFLKKAEQHSLVTFDECFQGCIRNNPEAFFSKRIIVCEGATEVGICRALNEFRIESGESNFEMLGISLVDGTGANFIKYCFDFFAAGIDVCAFCDSDDPAINEKKKELINIGIQVVDCSAGCSIEQQLFNDLPWEKVTRLVKYAEIERSEQGILANTGKLSKSELTDQDLPGIRILLGNAAKQHDWFKRIELGKKLGRVWFNSLSEITSKHLHTQYCHLSSWINK